MGMYHLVRVGLLGLGTVGSGVVKIIEKNQEDLFQQTGSHMRIEKVLVQDISKERSVTLEKGLLTEDVNDVLGHPDIDVVIEVMGGIETAREYILTALEQGKHIVTANKDLMALHGSEILAKAAKHKCDVYYEASVAGGIPIIRALVDSFSSDRITKMMGIVNGTTNYILSKMSQEGSQFEDVLKEAQSLGFAESDPTADIEGHDAARKMAILSRLGFYVDVDLADVECEGITQVTAPDLAYAKQLGYEMKLLGVAARKDDLIEVSVQPTLVKLDHPLAAVNGVNNAVYVYGEAVGETMFYGPGAGELPTATSIVSDLVSVVRNLRMGVSGLRVVNSYHEKKIKSDEQITAKYFMRLLVKDEAGVFAQMTSALAEEDISMKTVFQQPLDGKDESEIIMITYSTTRAHLKNITRKFKEMDVILDIKSIYRVENGE